MTTEPEVADISIAAEEQSESEAQSEAEEHSSEVSSDPDEDWKDRLRECLDAVVSAGQITSFQRYTNFTNPGLKIEGHPVIPLPLTEPIAQTIKSACRQAPFGRGDETLVDTSVRNTWELDHTQFSTANPAWTTFFNNVLTVTAKDIGLEQIRAKPHKLLLYEPGSFFRKHKDSEKEAGMVGTLVICLPSEHQGADVHVSFGSEKRVLRTAPASAFDLTALAWYSDVTHEVKQLTSGYRLVLTYKLFQSGAAGNSATAVLAQQQLLGTLLRNWRTKHDETREVFYRLDHKYTKSSVSLSNMKGRDRAVCQALADVGSQAGFFLLFGHVTHSRDSGDWDAAFTELNEVYSPDGKLVSFTCDIEQDDIMGANWNWQNYDSQSEGDFTGNESMPATLRYHDTVAILFRKEDLWLRFMVLGMNRDSDFSVPINMIDMVHKDLLKNPNSPVSRAAAKVSMDHALQYKFEWGPRTVGIFMKWTLAFRYHDLLPKVIQFARGRESTMSPVGREISNHLQRNYAIKEDIVDWDKWLDLLAQGAEGGEAELIFQRFQSSLTTKELRDSFINWRQTTVERKLNSGCEWKLEDHDLIMRSLYERVQDTGWTMERLLPSVASNGNREIIFAVLHTIYMVKDRRFPGRASEMYKCIFRHSDSKLILRARHLRKIDQSSEGIMETVKTFFRMLDEGHEVGVGKETIKILDEACASLVTTFNSWLANASSLPFIRQVLLPLALRLRRHDIEPISSVREFYEICLQEIQEKLLPPKPRTISNDWKHKPRKCQSSVPQLRGPCEDCQALNVFMKSADRETWHFIANQARRRHVLFDLPADLFHTTTQYTKPQTLVVTKLGTEYDRTVGRYQKVVADIREMLEPLQSPCLEELLGEEKYSVLVKLEEAPPRRNVEDDPVGESGSNRGLTPTSGNAAAMRRGAGDDAAQSAAKRPRRRRTRGSG
ncbi:Fc.00g060000.m01.CDS01 [Cosmosporella sp. VM-42]